LTGAFAALTAVCGFFKVPLGFTFITLQTMMAALAGILLGAKWGAASQAVYLVLGLVGLPIFTQGGGPGYIFQPSFGFLLGFPLTAAVSAWVLGDSTSPLRTALAAGAGILAGYLIGTPYMGLILNVYMGKGLDVWTVVKTGCLIYLPGEAVKVIFTAVVAPPLKRAMKKSELI
jgi:biotin transport system substrate-specific component